MWYNVSFLATKLEHFPIDLCSQLALWKYNLIPNTTNSRSTMTTGTKPADYKSVKEQEPCAPNCGKCHTIVTRLAPALHCMPYQPVIASFKQLSGCGFCGRRFVHNTVLLLTR